MFEIKLYLTGQRKRSKKVIEDLEAFLEAECKGQYALEIIDVLEKPRLAEDAGILATPTVIKTAPSPKATVIGDLSNKEKVLAALGIER